MGNRHLGDPHGANMGNGLTQCPATGNNTKLGGTQILQMLIS